MSKNIWYWLSNRFFQIANRRNASRIRRFGAGAPRRQSHHRSLHVEVLEDRCYLSASLGSEGESRAAGLGAPLAAISEQQAVALAVNNLTATQEGFVLTNPRHTATFTSEGLRMEPADGGPQWQWQLSYVGTLFNSLAGVQVGLVAPESSGANLVSYDRGGLIEQYVAHAGSIEQQFVIPQPLALGGGDLVLAGTVHSAGFFEATTDGWQWSTDAGAISLGDVTVLDATGSEIAASMQVNATGTRIVIEADVLAGALYPLLIDPEVGANDFRISDMGPDASVFAGRTPAVAYNSTNNEYLVVWSGDDVTNDEFEIFGQRINAATGAEVGTNDFRISDMGPDGDANFDAFTPAVAYRSTNNQYLVVWSGDDNTGLLVNNEFEIFGQRINAATGAEVGTNDFRISDMGTDGNANFDALTPEVVACSSFKTEYLVVWSADDNTATLVDDEFEIFGQRLNAATGAEDGTNDFRISNMGPDGNTIFRANQPALAYNSKNNEYFVVWRGNNNTVPQPVFGEGEFEIFGQRLDVISNAEVGTNDFRISDMGPDGNINFEAASRRWPTTARITFSWWSGRAKTTPRRSWTRNVRFSASGSSRPPARRSARTTFASAIWGRTGMRASTPSNQPWLTTARITNTW